MTYLHQGDNGNPTTNLYFTGNLISRSWYQHITNSRGQPDSVAIILLGEIISLYHINIKDNKSKLNSFKVNYDDLSKQLGFSIYQLREAIKRLEELLLVKREIKSEKLYGLHVSNIVYMSLNINNLLNITPKCEWIKQILLDPEEILKSPLGFPQDINIDYKTNKNINNRSIKDNVSDFNKNLFEEKPVSTSIDKLVQGQETTPIALAPSGRITDSETKQISNTLKVINSDSCINLIVPDSGMILHNSIKELQKVNRQSQPISYFLPLDSNDIDVLTKIVKKEFGSTFINALGQKLADKYPEHKFPNKEAFLKYIAIALTNEKHDPIKVNNINFAYISKTEQFLSKYEASNDDFVAQRINYGV